MIYVDDFMIVGKEETVYQVAATIRAVWKASEVQVAREGEPVRFLGMSIEVDARAVLEGGIALLGSAALLKDLEMDHAEKVIHVDSTSALAISEESESWRTRHLRVKAEWLSERLQTGEFSIQHCAGRVQLADFLTKVMTWARIRELLLLWGFNVEDDPAMVGATTSSQMQVNSSSHKHHTHLQPPSQAARVLAVLLLLSTIPKGASTGLEFWSEPQPLRLDSTLLSGAVVVSIVFLLILGWELLRWAGIQTYDRFGPGSTSRRLQRFQRLGDVTARAIEEELLRRTGQQQSLQPQPNARAGSRQRQLEGRARPSPSRSCTEGRSSSSLAVVSIGTMTGGAEAGGGTRDVAVQAEMGFTYLAPPPVKEIRIEQVVHGGPYYVTDHGNHVRLYENCWGMRNARPKARFLCKCCEQNDGRSSKDGSTAARGDCKSPNPSGMCRGGV